MRARLQILLAGCLGLVIGFTVCLFWYVDRSDDQSETSASSSTSVVSIASTQGSVRSSGSSNVAWLQTELMQDRQFVAPGWARPHDWKITFWYPTYPPQKGGTFYVAEYVERTMRLTNR
jgi:hypothetical protein